eukprot:TRINITY_DN19621_c0_g2_i1.p1 TRINITY_DN19621_c0_g2~~TRINITY_DN19621_c0_g2_i1.p1  ORF type:complete len:430 (+),score=64.68 TRINITY_DN19621_c0_g2_i1:60-1349(+)
MMAVVDHQPCFGTADFDWLDFKAARAVSRRRTCERKRALYERKHGVSDQDRCCSGNANVRGRSCRSPQHRSVIDDQHGAARAALRTRLAHGSVETKADMPCISGGIHSSNKWLPLWRRPQKSSVSPVLKFQASPALCIEDVQTCDDFELDAGCCSSDESSDDSVERPQFPRLTCESSSALKIRWASGRADIGGRHVAASTDCRQDVHTSYSNVDLRSCGSCAIGSAKVATAVLASAKAVKAKQKQAKKGERRRSCGKRRREHYQHVEINTVSSIADDFRQDEAAQAFEEDAATSNNSKRRKSCRHTPDSVVLHDVSQPESATQIVASVGNTLGKEMKRADAETPHVANSCQEAEQQQRTHASLQELLHARVATVVPNEVDSEGCQEDFEWELVSLPAASCNVGAHMNLVEKATCAANDADCDEWAFLDA